MQYPAFVVTDRTGASDVIAYVHGKLSGYDIHLLDWARVSPAEADPAPATARQPVPATHAQHLLDPA